MQGGNGQHATPNIYDYNFFKLISSIFENLKLRSCLTVRNQTFSPPPPHPPTPVISTKARHSLLLLVNTAWES